LCTVQRPLGPALSIFTIRVIYSQLRSQGALPLTPDGDVGRKTWFAIRDTLLNGAVNGNYWSDMGLGVSTSTYGKYYVNGTPVF